MNTTITSLPSPQLESTSLIATAIARARAIQEPGTTRREWRLFEHLEPNLRLACQGRLAEIGELFRPAGASEIAGHVGALYVALVPRRWSPEEANAALKLYVTDLKSLPSFAIEGACSRFRRGEAGDGRWMPTGAELRREANRLSEPLKVEKLDLESLLGARIAQSTGPDRPTMKAAFSALANELRAAPPPRHERPCSNADRPTPPPMTFEEVVSTYRESPVLLSDEALRSIRPEAALWAWKEAA